ncbi:MAG TPA: thiamine phosphate synthase, partial [Candidatus Binataceae bacterium]|nr:thiamine phosphate synthase [Candidatus Binataceae bacterium]
MNRTPRPPADFQLYLISDRRLVAPRGLVEVCDEVLGALARDPSDIRTALQLREKDLGGRELYQLATALRSICTRYGAYLIVNDRADVTLAAAADGVHLPADSIAIADARRLMGPSRLVGVSTHSPAEAADATAAGADFAVFGPVWPPLSKPGYGPARGAEELAAACRAAVGMPLYALGGITAERVAALGAPPGGTAAAGAGGRPAGVAVIGAVFGADDPVAAALRLARALRR